MSDQTNPTNTFEKMKGKVTNTAEDLAKKTGETTSEIGGKAEEIADEGINKVKGLFHHKEDK